MRKTAAAGERKREGVPKHKMAYGLSVSNMFGRENISFRDCKFMYELTYTLTYLLLYMVKLNRLSLRKKKHAFGILIENQRGKYNYRIWCTDFKTVSSFRQIKLLFTYKHTHASIFFTDRQH
ncbi:hypothetical protein E3U43_005631 [Larimichthys crocea]|uniref:Uncharacterized protein n=1 Tax=Larimichthys crocea TaxID=215358 RepID=A0ACD3QLX0_LARCR|nr:hypothetical protein E3U43_005631 [Larimichthys crocea]